MQVLWGERVRHFFLAYMLGCYFTCFFVIAGACVEGGVKFIIGRNANDAQ